MALSEHLEKTWVSSLQAKVDTSKSSGCFLLRRLKQAQDSKPGIEISWRAGAAWGYFILNATLAQLCADAMMLAIAAVVPSLWSFQGALTCNHSHLLSAVYPGGLDQTSSLRDSQSEAVLPSKSFEAEPETLHV